MRRVGEIMSSLWRCEFCGGPAKWTIIDGAPYSHCQRACAGFLQAELFDEPEHGGAQWVGTLEGGDANESEGEDQWPDPEGSGLPF